MYQLKINSFMTNKAKDHGKKHFCRYCFQYFSILGILESLKENYLATSHLKSFLLPKEGTF